MIDLGTGKGLHTITCRGMKGVAMFGNIVTVCGADPDGGHYINFYHAATLP